MLGFAPVVVISDKMFWPDNISFVGNEPLFDGCIVGGGNQGMFVQPRQAADMM